MAQKTSKKSGASKKSGGKRQYTAADLSFNFGANAGMKIKKKPAGGGAV